MIETVSPEPVAPHDRQRIDWRSEKLHMVIQTDDEHRPRLTALGPIDAHPPDDRWQTALPLAEIWLAGEGRTRDTTSPRQVGGSLSARLSYVAHEITLNTLTVTTTDVVSGLFVESHYSVPGDGATLRSFTTVRNGAEHPVDLAYVSSLLMGGLFGRDTGWRDHARLSYAHNTWFREAQWRSFSMSDLGLDDPGVAQWNAPSSRACFTLANGGSWSSGGHLPMGALQGGGSGAAWLWQIEHNGPWRWEVGDHGEDLYLIAGGPNDHDHQWTVTLAPGETFTSVPVALTQAAGYPNEAFATLTTYRRSIRRPHADNETLPVIFNDFMNCLMANADEIKLVPLIDAAREVGAEYFCLDAGWYADGTDWWDDVGEWEASPIRFPNGLSAIMDRIRAAGMTAGLWLEPEVIGTRSPTARKLPSDAFFQRNGRRVVEADRYQLDFSHPAVTDHMNAVIDRLVKDFGVGYFKFDYNIDVTQGTDRDGMPGHGMLRHARAYVKWIDDVLNRYPSVVIENCGSGGQRLDYALLSRHSIQSVTDQQDAYLHAAISASAPTAATPEQAGGWAYPQPEWDDEQIAFTMVNALLGRIILSGRVDRLSPGQKGLVAEAVSVYKGLRLELRTAVPFWPIGLPGWSDPWLALGMAVPGGPRYLSIWRRNGPSDVEFPLPDLKGLVVSIFCVYPLAADVHWNWDSSRAVLSVRLEGFPRARLLRLNVNNLAVQPGGIVIGTRS